MYLPPLFHESVFVRDHLASPRVENKTIGLVPFYPLPPESAYRLIRRTWTFGKNRANPPGMDLNVPTRKALQIDPLPHHSAEKDGLH